MSSFASVLFSYVILAAVFVLSLAGEYCYTGGYKEWCTYDCCNYGCCISSWFIYQQWWFWLIWVGIFVIVVVVVVFCCRRRANRGAVLRAQPATTVLQTTTGQPGAYPPGAYPPGAYQAGAYPQGAYPAGAYPQGAYPATNQQYPGQGYGYTAPAEYGYDNKASAPPTENPPPYAQ